MQLVVNCHDRTSESCGHCRSCLPVEVYGHLAAALRLQLEEATDERLKTLASSRFLNTLGFTFNLRARRPAFNMSLCQLNCTKARYA